MTEPDRLQQELTRCWPLAQRHWSRFLLLTEPVDHDELRSVAQIDLKTRQVSVNGSLIEEKQLVGSLEAILAHEIGHHVRYPGSLTVQARLRLLERSLIPFDDFSVINLFTDLLINERLGHDLKEQLAAVYQAFTSDGVFHQDEIHWKRDPSFLFSLAVYEELWRMPVGSLMGPAMTEFDSHFPGYRSEAQLLSQTLFGLGPNLYAQFLYFLSIVCHYIPPVDQDEPTIINPYTCRCGVPDEEDWAEALTPTARESEAIERAIREGWFSHEEADRLRQMSDIEERIARLPGQGTDNAQRVPEIMAAWYRRQAETFLLQPPPQRRLGEAIVPTTLEDWEAGEPVQEIDWLATLTQKGDQLGVVSPLKRTRIAESEGGEVSFWQPRLEIYLDVSGSMPDPRSYVNAMTLAAQILTLGTVRANGWVRSALYSSAPVLYWQWCRSEVEMSRFLMHYVGAGTDFPFDLLAQSVSECEHDQPVRVIITDSDFDWNYQNPEHQTTNERILSGAAAKSSPLVLLQHDPQTESVAQYRSLGVTVVEVAEFTDFPGLARDLTFSLFPDGADGNFYAKTVTVGCTPSS